VKKRGKKASLRKSHRRSRRRNPGLAGRASRRRGISELQDQLTATANQLKHRPGLSRRIRKMVSTYCSGEAESRLARELQDRLLPTKPPEISGLQIATRLIRSRDGVTALYDIFEIGEGTVGFFIAETSCKGLEAALLLTLTKVALDAARARPLAGKSRPASPTRLALRPRALRHAQGGERREAPASLRTAQGRVVAGGRRRLRLCGEVSFPVWLRLCRADSDLLQIDKQSASLSSL